MDKCREQFEEWAAQYDYDLTWSDLIDAYNFSVTRILFDTWQASRQALVVELPDWSEYDTPRQALDAAKDRLDLVGIKWTE